MTPGYLGTAGGMFHRVQRRTVTPGRIARGGARWLVLRLPRPAVLPCLPSTIEPVQPLKRYEAECQLSAERSQPLQLDLRVLGISVKADQERRRAVTRGDVDLETSVRRRRDGAL